MLRLKAKHRLMCGDSTSAEDVARLFDGTEPQMMITDPPYGVNYAPTWREGLGSSVRRTEYMDAATDTNQSWDAVWPLFPGSVAYIWHSHRQASPIQAAMEAQGFEFAQQIVWVKSVWPFSRARWAFRHEPCLFMVRDGAALWEPKDTDDPKERTTVWEARPIGAAFGRTKDSDTGADEATEHACQKPVELMERAIRHHSAADVYEPFAGSGTTLIACAKLGRRCLAMEISPEFVDIAVERWERFVGRKAVVS